MKICAAHAGHDQGEHHARQHWDFRHQMAYRYQERLKSQGGRFRRERGWRQLMDYLHASLPASEVVGFYQWSKALIAERGLGLYEAAIWTDAELFSLLLGDPTEGDPGDAGRSNNLARTTDDILMKAQDLGGSMEYCHGVGVKLLHLLDREWGAGAEVVHGMKASLDPRRIMNPRQVGTVADAETLQPTVSGPSMDAPRPAAHRPLGGGPVGSGRLLQLRFHEWPARGYCAPHANSHAH